MRRQEVISMVLIFRIQQVNTECVITAMMMVLLKMHLEI